MRQVLSPDTMYISLDEKLMGTTVLGLRRVLSFSVGFRHRRRMEIASPLSKVTQYSMFLF